MYTISIFILLPPTPVNEKNIKVDFNLGLLAAKIVHNF